MELAARQHRCVSTAQLADLGFGRNAIAHRVATGRLVALHQSVYAVAPVGDDDRSRWMGAALTTPDSFVSHAAAGTAYGFWPFSPAVPIVTRPGSGGPRLLDGVQVFRSVLLAGDTDTWEGIPITTPERTAIDLAARATPERTGRMVREAIRLKVTTAADLLDGVRRHPGRRGVRRLYVAVSRYAGLPLSRTRSDAEARALELIREWGCPAPQVNVRIAGEEADLSWPEHRLVIEIDGPQFHLDAAEDARKEAVWRAAGWSVHRIPSDDVYLRPDRLRALIPPPNVRQRPL